MSANVIESSAAASVEACHDACPLCENSACETVGIKDGYTVMRCTSCGLYYTQQMPSPQALAEYYADYDVNTKNIRYGSAKIRRYFMRLAPLRFLTARKAFLDVGCNTGFCVEAARRLGFEQCVGLDLSAGAIEIAQRQYGHNEFYCQTLEDFAATGRQFDAVVCMEVIEHLAQLHDFLDALRRITRPGGMLYITTPDAGHWRRPRDFLAWQQCCPPHHLVWFQRSTMRRALEKYGFAVRCYMPMLKPNLRAWARRIT